MADSKAQAGRLRGTTAEVILNVQAEILATKRVREVIVREGPDGQVTRVAYIALAEPGARTPAAQAALHDGRLALLVAGKLEGGLQVDVWMGHVRVALDDHRTDVPGGIELRLIFDLSVDRAERLRDLGSSMALGLALVVEIVPVLRCNLTMFGSQARHLADPDADDVVLLGGQDGWLDSTNCADRVRPFQSGGLIRVPLTPAAAAAAFRHRNAFEPAVPRGL